MGLRCYVFGGFLSVLSQWAVASCVFYDLLHYFHFMLELSVSDYCNLYKPFSVS